MPNENLRLIFWLMLAACAIPGAIIADSLRHIDISAAAEDDCGEYYGAYQLSEVVPVVSGGLAHVICRYK